MRRFASLLIFTAGLAVVFLLGWWARGNHFPDAGEVSVRIDTIYYERPQHVSSTVRPVTVNVPRLLFAGESCKSYAGDSANVRETDSVVAYFATTDYGEQCANNAQSSGSCSEIPNNSAAANQDTNQDAAADSVAVEIAIETRLYEDSLYRAQVSGPAVAGYHPTLDWIETYSRTQTITRTRRNRFAVTAGVGAAYTPRGFQPTVGVQVGVVLWSF